MYDYKETQSPGMASASLVLGILSLLLVCCGASLFAGALGILLALLSRGRGEMSGSAKAGMGLSLAGVVLGMFLLIFVLLFSNVSNIYEEYSDELDIEEFLEDYGGSPYSSPYGSYDSYSYPDRGSSWQSPYGSL